MKQTSHEVTWDRREAITCQLRFKPLEIADGAETRTSFTEQEQRADLENALYDEHKVRDQSSKTAAPSPTA